MNSRVVSVRLPLEVVEGLEGIAALNRVSVAVIVDLFLVASLSNSELLRGLQDCQQQCDKKLDARIPVATLEPVRTAATRLGVSVAVYTRTLLYHSFITKKLRYAQSQGNYTLAYRHD